MKTRDAKIVADELRVLRQQEKDGVVACDGDGTLWTGDVGEDFFFHVLAHEAVLEPATEKARVIAREHGIASAGGRELFDALYAAYRAGSLAEDLVCEIMGWIVAGHDRKTVDAIARRVHQPGEILSRLVPETKLVLDAAVDFYIVSASPSAIVRAALESLGMDPDRAVALESVWAGGGAGSPPLMGGGAGGDVMQPEAVRPIPYGEGKVTSLKRRIGSRPLIAALGDSGFDVPMLEAARMAIAVRPKPTLLARAPEKAFSLTESH